MNYPRLHTTDEISRAISDIWPEATNISTYGDFHSGLFYLDGVECNAVQNGFGYTHFYKYDGVELMVPDAKMSKTFNEKYQIPYE